ncbi:putative phospholipase C20G8.02, mitochondrial [Ceratocystis lukuohia]|uniref:Phospholipase C20G8.02, mitochondrial n=1 Tax=Ceratocystis lukuohia TaxID=2019550 RepID=A0ABR4MI53_9PEZI
MPSTAAKSEKKPEKAHSYLDSINPWAASRSSTPATPVRDTSSPLSITSAPITKKVDHSTSHLYGRSLSSYPADCPPLNVMWYHAVDNPKRKPQLPPAPNVSSNANSTKKPTEEKPLPPAKKFLSFSNSDSRALEAAYQELLEKSEERFRNRPRSGTHGSLDDDYSYSAIQDVESDVKVPVNEDYLFDVDIAKRELGPVYWQGPIYEVRRGTWFTQEGSKLVPCEENLAAQLEEGYLKVKPWLYTPPLSKSEKGTATATKGQTPKSSAENLKPPSTEQTLVAIASPTTGAAKSAEAPSTPQSHRLFGTYMNSVATYQDDTTAWLSSDGMFSWVTSAVYGTFAGAGHLSGIKLIRGYQEPGKGKDKDKDKEKDKDIEGCRTPVTPITPGLQATATDKASKRRSVAILGQTTKDPEITTSQDEELRKRQESEIRNDYNDEHDSQGREIEHLVLVTHGIGQMLSLRMESINFIHDVNLLRKTIKSVYSSSADLKALNGDLGKGTENCRVQVLPVCWRHLLDFPKKRDRKHEADIGDLDEFDEDEYPSLEDITVEGVAFARSLMSDLALDVLLYQSGYREQIIKIVTQEANHIWKLFKQRNPNFKGKVHIMGHSLGSALMFDILCRQKQDSPKSKSNQLSTRLYTGDKLSRGKSHSGSREHLSLDFDVSDLYCLGSPIGLFQMLKGRTIAARQNATPPGPVVIDLEDPDFEERRISSITGLPHSMSSPKVEQLFNIIHPSDPIAYRMEPLISPAMKTLKPQNLPYTKKGIFGSVAPQGLSSIGMKVGQSVSGLWSSFSSGITTSLINRSLGLTNDEVARFNAGSVANSNDDEASEVGKAVNAANKLGELTNARKRQLADPTNNTQGRPSMSGNEPTLIDDDLETLYSKFQKTRKDRTDKDKDTVSKLGSNGSDKGNSSPSSTASLSAMAEGWDDVERRSNKIRREEQKVRALNRNSRVDFTIQEGVLDYNPINAIASHMGYWADEDVSHFFLSQLLSNRTGRINTANKRRR